MCGQIASTSAPNPGASPYAVVAQLRARLQQWERGRAGRERQPAGLGCPGWDRLLPPGAIDRGSLIEFLGESGGGAGTLALLLARHVARQDGTIVVLDAAGWFYPPAAALLGLDLERMLVVRQVSERELIWAWEQALCCPAVAAVWGPVAKLEPGVYRRLALAAERGGGVGLLIRPSAVQGQPCWSTVQLRIAPLPETGVEGSVARGSGRRLRIEVTRCRLGPPGAVADWELDELTGALTVSERGPVWRGAQRADGGDEADGVPVASRVADSAVGGRAARA